MNAGSPQLDSSNTKSDISSVRLTHATSVASSHIHLDTTGRKATISTQNSSHSTLATKKSDSSRRATRRGKMLTERQQYVSELLFQHRQHFNWSPIFLSMHIAESCTYRCLFVYLPKWWNINSDVKLVIVHVVYLPFEFRPVQYCGCDHPECIPANVSMFGVNRLIYTAEIIFKAHV